jgi:hypothetical protein
MTERSPRQPSAAKKGRPPIPLPAFVERQFGDVVPANAAEVIERMAAEGTPVALIARELGTSARTLGRWRREHPTLQEAFEVGRARLEFELIKEVRRGKGEYVRAFFMLKTMFGYREQGEPPASVNQMQVNIALPGSMTMDAFREMRNANDARARDDRGESVLRDKQFPKPGPGITARA